MLPQKSTERQFQAAAGHRSSHIVLFRPDSTLSVSDLSGVVGASCSSKVSVNAMPGEESDFPMIVLVFDNLRDIPEAADTLDKMVSELPVAPCLQEAVVTC